MCDTSSVSAAQKSALQTQISVSVLAKQQSAVKQQGQAIVDMLQAAAQINVDNGEQFDAIA